MNALERLRAVLCAPDGDVVIDGTDSDRSIVSEALKELEAALALSRGVPDGGPGDCGDMARAWLAVTDTLNEVFPQWIESNKVGRECACDAIRYLAERSRIAAAPAAAGAQGEAIALAHDAETWGNALNEAAWVFVEECPEKSALLFNNTKGPLRAAILKYAELVGSIAPQPAAADGGVRERARELLAKWYRAAGRYEDAGRLCMSGTAVDTEENIALLAVEDALSSHRRAGDESKFRELAEGWTQHGEALHANGFDIRGAAMHKCARELLALVEKGAGS